MIWMTESDFSILLRLGQGFVLIFRADLLIDHPQRLCMLVSHGT